MTLATAQKKTKNNMIAPYEPAGKELKAIQDAEGRAFIWSRARREAEEASESRVPSKLLTASRYHPPAKVVAVASTRQKDREKAEAKATEKNRQQFKERRKERKRARWQKKREEEGLKKGLALTKPTKAHIKLAFDLSRSFQRLFRSMRSKRIQREELLKGRQVHLRRISKYRLHLVRKVEEASQALDAASASDTMAEAVRSTSTAESIENDDGSVSIVSAPKVEEEAAPKVEEEEEEEEKKVRVREPFWL